MTSKSLLKGTKAKIWQIRQYAEKVSFNAENGQYCISEQFQMYGLFILLNQYRIIFKMSP